MFTQEHAEDFTAVLTATKPFAMIRFGDGELALLDGRVHKSADSWTATGPVWLQGELYETLQTKLDRIALGLPPACCLSRGLKLRGAAQVPKRMQTFATLFMHGNLPRMKQFRDRYANAVIVNDKYGDIKIPSDGVTEKWDLNAIVAKLLEVRDRPILLSAGPCANLIALRYWTRQDPLDRVPIIDVGSALDVLHGYSNRHYHGNMNDHVCTWNEADRAPVKTGTQAIRAVSGRVRLGRVLQTPGVKKIQRVQKRKRIGKP